jgi:hypothetical protein
MGWLRKAYKIRLTVAESYAAQDREEVTRKAIELDRELSGGVFQSSASTPSITGAEFGHAPTVDISKTPDRRVYPRDVAHLYGERSRKHLPWWAKLYGKYVEPLHVSRETKKLVAYELGKILDGIQTNSKR